MRKQILHAVLVLLLGAGAVLFILWPAPKALAANPTTINFQGRVTNPNGTNVTDGSYSFVFRLYDQSSPTTTGTCASNTHCWWEETDTLSVTAGVFQVQLGTTCAFSSTCNSGHSGINWNTNNALYLTLQFNSDSAGFMSPTIPLTSVPYAFNADNLGGLSSSGFIQNQNGSAQSSSNFWISGTGIASAFQAGSLAAASGNLNLQAASGSINLSTSAGGSVSVAAAAPPTANQVTISNAGQAVATNNVNGLNVNYTGGGGTIEAAGMRIDYTPGSTSGSTWSGLRIVANATGAASGVSAYGLKLEGPTAAGTGVDEAVYVGTGWDIGLDIQSGGIQLAASTTDPPTPSGSNLKVYAKSVAGRYMLKVLAPTGVNYPLQPSLFGNQVMLINNNGATSCTTWNTLGTGLSVTGSNTTCTISATEAYGYMKNAISSSSTSPSTWGIGTDAAFFRGSQVGANGFFFQSRFALPDASYSGNFRTFIGMTSLAANTMTTSANPSGQYVGLQWVNDGTRNDTNWQVVTNDGTTQHLTDTGFAFTPSKTYDVYLFCAKQCSTVYWRIDNLNDNTTAQDISTGVSANLPSAATAMRGVFSSTVTNTTQRNARFSRIYVESDR